jgi:uncharacterized protein YjbI with pentapeptide repeats
VNAELTSNIWRCLTTGTGLESLRLPVHEGRIDLRGLSAPQPAVVCEQQYAGATVQELGGVTTIRGARWHRLDMSNSVLSSLRFLDCSIEDCRLDGAACDDWRLWATRVSHVTFRGANLRNAALGGIHEGRRNAFLDVDFTKADLRGSAHGSADFERCTFHTTNLKKVDFQGSVFRDCVFVGKLDEVMFYDYMFRGEAFPRNEMQGVDFSRAIFRNVEFRHLDMADVRWPVNDDHVVVDGYVPALDRVLALVAGRTDLPARRLAGTVGMMRKWAGPKQQVGVVTQSWIREVAGGELADEALRIFKQQH